LHRTIALVLYSLAIVAFVVGQFWGGVGFVAGGLFAQFFGKKVENEA
jgi:hypothetical protein